MPGFQIQTKRNIYFQKSEHNQAFFIPSNTTVHIRGGVSASELYWWTKNGRKVSYKLASSKEKIFQFIQEEQKSA